MSDKQPNQLWSVANIFQPQELAILSNYVQLNYQNHPKRKGKDRNLYQVYRQYGDPLLESFFPRVKKMAEEVTGKSLLPTLSFLYHYEGNNILTPHKDRINCEYVVGICIDADNEFKARNYSWSLHFDIGGVVHSPKLQFGDGIIFKGSQTRHWREAFVGQWYISVIFAFVDAKGKHAYLTQDFRKNLGLPHVGMFNWSGRVVYHSIKNWLAKK